MCIKCNIILCLHTPWQLRNKLSKKEHCNIFKTLLSYHGACEQIFIMSDRILFNLFARSVAIMRLHVNQQVIS